MASVVGLTVWVKLKQPSPNDVLYGVVRDLVPNSHLALEHVFIPATGMRWEQWTVQASAIDNLEVIDPSAVPLPQAPPSIPSQAPPPGFRQSYTPSQHPFPQPPPQYRHVSGAPTTVPLPAQSQAPHGPTPAPAAPPPQRQPSTFVDPAIVSYGPSSPTPHKPAPRSSEVETPIKSMLARAAANLPSPGSPFIADAGKSSNNITQKLRDASKQPVPSSVVPPVPIKPSPAVPSDRAAAESGLQDSPRDAQQDGAKKKIRRGQKGKKQVPNPIDIADPPPIMNTEVSRNGNDMNGNVKRGKGWRNTPLLQPSPQTASSAEKPNGTRKNRRKQKEDDALGDTTDIADMGDFDFEANLKNFDKKQVFDEIRQGDTTADEDRLVSHNRIARPGTHGGKNLHPTEPVLSPPTQSTAGPYNSNELDSASDADTELNLGDRRSSSKHSVTRIVLPKSKPSRQNSGQIFDNKPHALAASLSSDMQRTRSTASLVNRTKTTSLAAASPQLDRAASPQSGRSATRAKRSKTKTPHFTILPHLSPCPTLLPRALEALEHATVSTFGLSYDAITENAGRCIAEAAIQLSTADSFRRPSRTNTARGSMTSSTALTDPNEPATIVVLAGNHAIGARALAAARHLLGRNIKIIAAESLIESAETQDAQVKSQTTILRRMARGGAGIKRGIWKKASSYIKNLTGPPAVIIDALLAGDTYDLLLSTNATHSSSSQQETREMIEWANRSRAPVLSVGCPSGISGIDGTSTIVEGEPISVRADRVITLGAPMQGLLQAMEAESLHVTVADIGINIALKSDEAVAFGAAGWSVDLKYVEGSDS